MTLETNLFPGSNLAHLTPIEHSQSPEDNINFAGIRRSSIKHLRGRERTVFINFLLQCNYSNNPKFYFDGKLLQLKRGDWVTSVKNIVEQSGLSTRSVRTALKNLCNMTSLKTNSLASRATLLSLENIDLYLVSPNELTNQVANKKTTRRQPADNPTTINNKNTNKNNKNTNKEYTNTDGFHLSISRKLSDHISSKKQLTFGDAQIKAWANEIALLEKKTLHNRQSAFNDIEKALEAVKSYDGDQFFPVIESGKAFRQKFSQIENFIKRQNPKSKNQQVLEALLAGGENDSE